MPEAAETTKQDAGPAESLEGDAALPRATSTPPPRSISHPSAAAVIVIGMAGCVEKKKSVVRRALPFAATWLKSTRCL